jgi:hypothetical protein
LSEDEPLEELDPPLPPEEDELVGDPEDESLDELPDESPEDAFFL